MIDIVDNQAFSKLCGRMKDQPILAMDTEFIRERTYFPILALLQISWRGQEPLLIDPLKVDDWVPFHQILQDPAICKIFHAARQDLEIFYYQMGTMPVNVFDTQIAASMCGYGDQIGYSALVDRLLNIHLSKSSSYTDWLKRPLTKAQLRYAREDVRYLPDLYDRLLAEAGRHQRVRWIEEETQLQLHGGLFEADPDELWRKVKRAGSLKARDAAVLRELAKWRDRLARDANKPVRFILADETLIELARIDHLKKDHLTAHRGLSKKFVERYGTAILENHERARALAPSDWPAIQKRQARLSSATESLADLAWLLIKDVARDAAIGPAHLIAKKELGYFVDSFRSGKALDHFPISRGWRWEIVGKPLLALLEGRLSIQVKDKKMVWKDP